MSKVTLNQVWYSGSANLAALINASGAWTGSPTGLQGATGSQGVQGLQGRQGASGSNGSQGAQGANGTNGSQGVQGANGTDGSQGVQGLSGTNGSQGVQGANGSQGVQGLQGRQGATGNTGTGTQGAQGTIGIQGLQGRQGASGTNGSQGIQGASGTNGSQGATGIQGATGSGGLTGSGSSTYLAKWSSGTNLSTGSAYESAGTVYSTDFVASSDARLKNILGFVDGGVSKINALNGVRYEWNPLALSLGYTNDRAPELGVLAQEVMAVIPEAVVVDDKGYLRVSYDRLVPVLIEAIKELNSKYEELERRIWDLE